MRRRGPERASARTNTKYVIEVVGREDALRSRSDRSTLHVGRLLTGLVGVLCASRLCARKPRGEKVQHFLCIVRLQRLSWRFRYMYVRSCLTRTVQGVRDCAPIHIIYLKDAVRAAACPAVRARRRRVVIASPSPRAEPEFIAFKNRSAGSDAVSHYCRSQPCTLSINILLS